MKILITGGAGYIGSHACVVLLEQGHELVIVDNLVNSSAESLHRVSSIAGKQLEYHHVDLLDSAGLDRVVTKANPEAVIHFAGLKAVGESVARPLHYYHNNIVGTLNLLRIMQEQKIYSLVFSSSATVYGQPDSVPISEDAPLRATNPYGQTKLMIEQILRDLAATDPEWRIALLRYFNPVGAHSSGKIGEDPQGIPNNLVPFIAQVATGKLERLKIYGNDYDTPDGTGVRDYLHVMDLAEGHAKALDYLESHKGIRAFNLGTGKGCSVLEVVAAFEQASGVEIAREFAPRRPGDAATCYADASLAEQDLGWKATRTLADMCADTWHWQSKNPRGYN